MRAGNYYEITALPALGELGSQPPITPEQFLEHLAENTGALQLIRVLFLLDDLLQREAFLAGETKQVDPLVLTRLQARNEEALPSFLVYDSEQVTRTAEADTLWELYFRHAMAVAKSTGSTFLSAWVSYEVALRNSLAEERAKQLGLEAGGYIVAADLASDEDFAQLITEWSSADTPLVALRMLTLARWSWIMDNNAWFTFKNDELAAYAAQLMLLNRWYLMSKADADDVAAASAIDSKEDDNTLSRTSQ